MPESHEALAELRIDRTRRRRRTLWPWVLLLFVGVLGFTAPQLVQAVRGVEVAVAPVLSSARSAGELSAAGYIVADRQSVLAFKGTGRLTQLTVTESQPVKKGELIAEIDHAELDAIIERAKAEVQAVQAEIPRLKVAVVQAEQEAAAARAPLPTFDFEIETLKIRLADAKRRLERDRKVALQNAIPFSGVEDIVTEVKLAESQIATTEQRKRETQQKLVAVDAQIALARAAIPVAEARVNTLAAQVKVLETQRLDSFVHSPFDGVVTEKAAEIGEIVAPISIGGSMARGSIVTIAEWSSLQAEVDVAEAYITKVKPSQRASITVDALPNRVFPGRVKRILPRANRSKATVQVRVEFLDPHEGVLPEMGVRVRFLPDDAPVGAETQTTQAKLLLPKAAVQSGPSGTFVWVIDDNMRAHPRPISVSALASDPVEALGGVAKGERVVTRGAEALKEDNQKVHLAE